jgi:hypothetical protein
MGEYMHPVLCGGIFFTLLLEARGQRTGKRGNAKGETDGLSQTDLLIELVKIIGKFNPPAKISTLKKNVGGYRQCDDNGGTYFSAALETENRVKAFDEKVKSNYASVLSDMSVLVARFIDEDKAVMLIKALLEVIGSDEALSDAVFYVGDESTTRDDLLKMESVCLPSFLLGVWHYIVLNVQDNTVGQPTFKEWHIKKGETNSQWVFREDIDIGNTVSQQITVLPFADYVSPIDEAEDESTQQGEPFVMGGDCECGSDFRMGAEDVIPKLQQNIYNQTINVNTDNNTINGFVFNLNQGGSV